MMCTLKVCVCICLMEIFFSAPRRHPQEEVRVRDEMSVHSVEGLRAALELDLGQEGGKATDAERTG